MTEWVNWSGSLRFTPAEFLTPRSEDELCEIVYQCFRSGRKVRIAGAGHSSSPLVQTSDTLIRLDHFKGKGAYDDQEQIIELKTGMTVHESSLALQESGLALFNTGDVDVQMLTGAISTGTHGSGKKLPNLSSLLAGVRMVTYSGELKSFSHTQHPELFKALRVSLGSFGIFTEISVKVLPLFKLQRLEICVSTDDCVEHFLQLADENRNVDFYWYPRSDETKIRILNEPGQGSKSFPFKYKIKKSEEGWIGEVLPRRRDLRFDEMEYAFEQQAGMACFQEIRERIKLKHRKEVAWRVLCRTIAKDDNYISPHFGRESLSISLHHNAGLPFENYFFDIEPIFIEYGGRPHWGKKHNLKCEQLKNLYPQWKKFHEHRKSFDPHDFFINPYLNELFYTR